jgi:enamine deaminase RidA (YjgF/YER057c/UK114 family)
MQVTGRIESRLAENGIQLPEAAAPAANYVPYIVSDRLVFVSGQVTMENGEIRYQGKVGEEFTVAEAQQAARLCAMNLISQLRAACGGDLDRVWRVVRLGGFVNSAPGFTDQHLVINGASDLMVEVFGTAGRHARAAVGVSELPFGVAVEVDGVFELTP